MNKDLVTVCVITYNPDFAKLKLTLDSIIMQRDVNFEVVVSDDGSNFFPQEDVKAYFAENGFDNYKLLINEVNSGTVMNIYRSLDTCEGKYIKIISPGDFFYDPSVLSKWLDFMNHGDFSVSCSNVLYYYEQNGEILARKCQRMPQDRGSLKSAKKYLLYGDRVHGAATLIKKDVFNKYLSEISGKVKYCEDLLYGLMVLDGLEIGYFPKCTICYESTSGISASVSSSWMQRIDDDNRIMKTIYIEHCAEMRKLLDESRRDSIGEYLFRIKRKLLRKYSETKMPDNNPALLKYLSSFIG